MKKNILFITMTPLEYNSSASIRNQGIIKGFSELSFNVDVLTSKPNANNSHYDDSMRNIYDLIENTYYIKNKEIYEKLSSSDKSSINNLADFEDKTIKQNLKKIFYPLKKIGKKTSRLFINKLMIFDPQSINVKNVHEVNIDYSKYDYIISSSDPKSSHLIALEIFKKNNLITTKWIQYWGDPFYHDIARNKKFFEKSVKKAEFNLISKGDRIIYASPITLEIQKNTFPNYSAKMDYANQVYHDSNDSYETNDKVGYYGAYHSNIRNIKPLYNVALEKGFELEIAGQSDLNLISTKNITVHDRLNYKDVVEREKKSKILIALCNESGTQIPGKIYYQSAYKQPIIVIIDGIYSSDIAKFLEGFDRFIICKNTKLDINKAIETAEEDILKNKIYSLKPELTPNYLANKILGNI